MPQPAGAERVHCLRPQTALHQRQVLRAAFRGRPYEGGPGCGGAAVHGRQDCSQGPRMGCDWGLVCLLECMPPLLARSGLAQGMRACNAQFDGLC